MSEDVLILDMPEIQIKYQEENYSYSRKNGRKNLKKVLYKASNNYCMYCYNRIKIDENQYGHLEHAMEKSISKGILTECIPNIGIACGTCNDKYKKIGEKKRRPDKGIIEEFEKNVECSEKNCIQPCKAYLKLKKEYLKKEEAQFLLQPLGVTSNDLNIDGKRKLKLQYDIIEEKFIPSKREIYSIQEKNFIRHHIDMFHLNTVERKSTQLIRFLEDTIEHGGRYSKIEYNNQIVELFVKQVLRGKEEKEILKICEKLYTYAVIKFKASKV